MERSQKFKKQPRHHKYALTTIEVYCPYAQNYSSSRAVASYVLLSKSLLSWSGCGGGWGENRGVLSLAEAARMAVGWRLAGAWTGAWTGACVEVPGRLFRFYNMFIVVARSKLHPSDRYRGCLGEASLSRLSPAEAFAEAIRGVQPSSSSPSL